LDQLESFDRVLVVEAGRVIADGAPETALPVYRELVK
jgi:biotin transport system ATP-binding protein